ncbi:MAG TPA: CPBP family intramembrane metalloprotease [Candidatus Hungatella pullicola]|nr:CPBP family intramembrane metalloprotease [Candidatus Hungatella pullicola]
MLVIHLILPVFLYSVLIVFLSLLIPLDSVGICTLASAICGAVFLWVHGKEEEQKGRKNSVRRIWVKGAGWIALLGSLLAVSLNCLIQILNLYAFSPTYSQVSQELYSSPVIWQIGGIVFLIPFNEEMMFRALGYIPAKDQLGFWPAAVLSSLLFGLYHGNLVQGVYAFCLGLTMAWLCQTSKSIWASVLFHISANLCSIILTATGLYLYVQNQRTVAAAVMVVSAAGGVLCFRKIMSLKGQ